MNIEVPYYGQQRLHILLLVHLTSSQSFSQLSHYFSLHYIHLSLLLGLSVTTSPG